MIHSSSSFFIHLLLPDGYTLVGARRPITSEKTLSLAVSGRGADDQRTSKQPKQDTAAASAAWLTLAQRIYLLRECCRGISYVRYNTSAFTLAYASGGGKESNGGTGGRQVGRRGLKLPLQMNAEVNTFLSVAAA
jgi:hypothetical protein